MNQYDVYSIQLALAIVRVAPISDLLDIPITNNNWLIYTDTDSRSDINYFLKVFIVMILHDLIFLIIILIERRDE